LTFNLANLKEMMKITIVVSILCFFIENFIAAHELHIDGNDLLMEDDLPMDRAANGYVKCEYCPKKEPYCHGVCDEYEEACVFGYCSKYTKPYKVSDQVRLSAIAHDQYEYNRNNDYEYVRVSMYNAFPQACHGNFVPPALINLTIGYDYGTTSGYGTTTDYYYSYYYDEKNGNNTDVEKDVENDVEDDVENDVEDDVENDVEMRDHYYSTYEPGSGYQIMFSVNSETSAIGGDYYNYNRVLKKISAEVYDQNCELVTSQSGPYMLLPIYKTKKGDKKIIGCYITNQ